VQGRRYNVSSEDNGKVLVFGTDTVGLILGDVEEGFECFFLSNYEGPVPLDIWLMILNPAGVFDASSCRIIQHRRKEAFSIRFRAGKWCVP
jgi:hypothetical protein